MDTSYVTNETGDPVFNDAGELLRSESDVDRVWMAEDWTCRHEWLTPEDEALYGNGAQLLENVETALEEHRDGVLLDMQIHAAEVERRVHRRRVWMLAGTFVATVGITELVHALF